MIGMEDATTYGPKCEKIPDLPPAAKAMGQVIKQAEGLAKTIQELRQRLKPILQPRIRNSGPSDGKPEMIVSPLVADLERVSNTLHGIDVEIGFLLGELDL